MKQASTKTISEIDGDVILISCFADLNMDDTTYPDLFDSDVLSKTKTINNVSGKEGELILSYDDGISTDLDVNGELTVNSMDDDATKYAVDENQGDLNYITNG